ncbi:MAG: hypothetical protein IJ642_05515 [Oscillospiraceae bacterium]|nr:hypothetical protein [Oscillospiraceae bacterium]
MKLSRELTKMIQETVGDAVRDAVKEKAESIRELPAAKHVQNAAQAFGEGSAEAVGVVMKFIQCFGIVITLLYAVRQLAKELKSPL